MKTRKKPVSTSIDPETFARLELLAKADNRSIAEVVAMCAKAGLPMVESSIRDHLHISVQPDKNGRVLIHYGRQKPFCPDDLFTPANRTSPPDYSIQKVEAAALNEK